MFEKEIPVWINTFSSQNIFITCMDNLLVFYLLDEFDGSFQEIHRIKTMEYSDFDLYQTCCTLSKSGNFLACGTSDGNLKTYQLKISNNKIEDLKLIKDFQAHVRDINDIVLIEQKNILITCSSDGSCKVFEMTSLKLLKKLTFRLGEHEKKGYLFRGMFYDEKNNYLYTTQAPLTGYSYITKWDAGSGFEPIDSSYISNVSTCSIDYDYKSGTLAIGDNKGSVIFMDANSLNRNKEINISDLSIKSLKYSNSVLITGSADNTIRVLVNHVKGWFSFLGFIKLVIFVIIAYLVLQKFYMKNNLK